MSTIQPITPVRNIFAPPPLVPLADYEPSPEEWAAYHERLRRERAAAGQGEPAEPPTERATYLPAVHWLALQVASNRDLSRETDDYPDVVATLLNDVACVMRGRKAGTAAELVAMPGHRFSGVDLASVALPTEARTSRVADLLDEQAQYYLDLGTDLARLAAHAILGLSELAEMVGAQSLDELWEKQAEMAGDDPGPRERFDAWA